MALVWIDETGIHRVRLADIKAQLEASYRAIYGVGIDLGTHSTDGQVIGNQSEMYSDFIQAMVDVFNGRAPAGAIGAQLARLVRLNGVRKNEPKFSETTETLIGTPGTFIAAGAKIANETDPTAVFATVTDATITGGGTVDVTVRATVAGPVPGDAGDLTAILTVIKGWTGATNAGSVSLGDPGENDGPLRARRASSVALPSQGIVDGLEALLLQTPDVTQAIVRENPEDTVQTLDDGGTLAPHAIQAIVRGGTDLDVATSIFLKRSAGCTIVGATSVVVTDSQGNDHTIKFDRPGEVPIYVVVNTGATRTSGEKALIKAAIVARGQGTLKVNDVPLPGSKIGKSVSVSDVYDAITWLKLTSLPTLKVGKIFIGTAPSPTLDNDIAVAYNHIATWDAVNITFASP